MDQPAGVSQPTQRSPATRGSSAPGFAGLSMLYRLRQLGLTARVSYLLSEGLQQEWE